MNEFSIGTFFPNKYLLELQDDWSLSNICQKVYDQFGRPLISASLRGTFRTQSNIRCEAFIKNRRTLGTDDLTIFKCFIVIFSLKKKTIQFPLSFNLYFQQKEPQSCQFATYRRNALFEFLTSQTGQMTFTIFKVIIRQLCISLTH